MQSLQAAQVTQTKPHMTTDTTVQISVSSHSKDTWDAKWWSNTGVGHASPKNYVALGSGRKSTCLSLSVVSFGRGSLVRNHRTFTVTTTATQQVWPCNAQAHQSAIQSKGHFGQFSEIESNACEERWPGRSASLKHDFFQLLLIYLGNTCICIYVKYTYLCI